MHAAGTASDRTTNARGRGFSTATVIDEKLERLIAEVYQRVVVETDVQRRRGFVNELVRLVKLRSAEQVVRMERDRGLR